MLRASSLWQLLLVVGGVADAVATLVAAAALGRRAKAAKIFARLRRAKFFARLRRAWVAREALPCAVCVTVVWASRAAARACEEGSPRTAEVKMITKFFYCRNRQISSSSIQRYQSHKSSAVGSILSRNCGSTLRAPIPWYV